MYVDDIIVLGLHKEEVNRVVEMLWHKFNIGKEGDICDNLGIKVTKNKDGTITLTQLYLIDSILQDLKLNTVNAKGRMIQNFLLSSYIAIYKGTHLVRASIIGA